MGCGGTCSSQGVKAPYIWSMKGVGVKSKIKYKLFFTLLLTSVVASLALHFYVKVSFERGFKEYVKEQELEQLGQLTGSLAKYFSHENSWDFIVENHALWERIHRENSVTYPRVLEAPNGRVRGGTPPPPPGPQPAFGQGSAGRHVGMGPRIVLYDAQKNWVIGGPEKSTYDKNFSLPIEVNSSTVGYLMLLPPEKFGFARDRQFVQAQAKNFAMIPLIIIVLSLLLSYPIAAHLLRPIQAMTIGTGKLIAGHFKTRIPVTTSDELGTLSADFNELARTLEKNEQNRKQWVADISHELRTPLSVLRGEVEAIQDGIRDADRETLDGLHYEVMHLERIVGDLYELSMSDIGALSYKKVEVDPIGILQGTVELFELRFSEKDIKVSVDYDSQLDVSLLADPDRLQQMFSNLLENSLRYTEAGGAVQLRLAVEKGNVVISIEDSLPTVPKDQLAKLFDRFYRVDGSRNRVTGGAGLGLAICKNIVEGHGGTIYAALSVLGGICITVKLPLTLSLQSA